MFLKEGLIIVFTDREDTNIKQELKGQKALVLKDCVSSERICIKILSGTLKGREMSGNCVPDKDFSLFALNKGK